MNTPYQWTKQVASHFGGTRDGLVVHWPAGIEAHGEVRHQFHHVIDVLPTILEVAGLPAPRVGRRRARSSRSRVRRCATRSTTPAPPTAARTQYFEMVGNRGIYHEGWTAVTRHGDAVADGRRRRRPFDDDVWELYDTRTDWTQAHDLAARAPRAARASCRRSSTRRPSKHQVLPLDDRVTERENPELAGRLDLHAAARR